MSNHLYDLSKTIEDLGMVEDQLQNIMPDSHSILHSPSNLSHIAEPIMSKSLCPSSLQLGASPEVVSLINTSKPGPPNIPGSDIDPGSIPLPPEEPEDFNTFTSVNGIPLVFTG